MKRTIAILTTTLLIACSNSLEEKEQIIELSYIAWACDCASWATKEDLQKYADKDADALAEHCIFIEPANKSLTLPDTLGYSMDIIKFTGRFYKRKGFPKEYSSQEKPDKARVFRYTKYQVIRSNYRESKIETSAKQ